MVIFDNPICFIFELFRRPSQLRWGASNSLILGGEEEEKLAFWAWMPQGFWVLCDLFDSFGLFLNLLKFLESFGIFWNVLECFGNFWNFLESFAMFWNFLEILESLGIFWSLYLLDSSWFIWILLESFESLGFMLAHASSCKLMPAIENIQYSFVVSGAP